jgi:hypothetical protein
MTTADHVADVYLEGPVTLAQLQSGAWVRPDHAAVALGVDERTIRRRVRRGTIARSTISGRVYVRLVEQPAQAQAHTDDSATDDINASLAVIVREQLDRLDHLSRELVIARTDNARLEGRLDAERERIASLTAELDRERQARQAAADELDRERQARLDAAAVIASEHARAARLEAIASSPWYAVRLRRRLRRELDETA